MEFEQTKNFSEFCEHLSDLRNKFQKWDSCEKTVALYYLMVGLPFANAKFLQNALNQLIPSINTTEGQILESNANDPIVISKFLTESPQSALCSLLEHLPLLKPGNKHAAQTYLNTIKRILTEFIMPPFKKIYNECVEIMSYVYIHPAFDNDDKRSFKHLLKQVLNKVSPETFIHSSPTSDLTDDSVTTTSSDIIRNNKENKANNLIPSYTFEIENWSSQENINNVISKPRSSSLSCEKNLLNICQMQTSNSDTRLTDIVLKNNLPIMKSILSWLKSLRLHKYCWIFQNLTANQMLNLTEDQLINFGITKGARHKLLLSLQKLKDRGKLLTDLEITILNGGDLNESLKELKSVLSSPMQITFGEDLCSKFIRVMGKVCTQLLTMRYPVDENLLLFNVLCERGEEMDCFSTEHKRKLKMWKEQLSFSSDLPFYYQTNYNRRNSIRRKYQKNNKTNIFALPIEPPSGAHKSSSYPNVQGASHFLNHRRSVDSVTLKNQLSFISNGNYQNFIKNENNNYISNTNGSKVHYQTTKDNLDIESSLESLCIQMMEHALGP